MDVIETLRKKPVKNLKRIALNNVRTFVHEQALLSSRFVIEYQPFLTINH